jgi:hypothetical protein
MPQAKFLDPIPLPFLSILLTSLLIRTKLHPKDGLSYGVTTTVGFHVPAQVET